MHPLAEAGSHATLNQDGAQQRSLFSREYPSYRPWLPQSGWRPNGRRVEGSHKKNTHWQRQSPNGSEKSCRFLFEPILLTYVYESFPSGLIPNDAAYVLADIVWPEDEREHSFPKRKSEEADCKQPSRKPREPRKTMIFHFDFVHTFFKE